MPRAVPVEKSDNNNNNNDEEQAEPAQKASSSSSSPHPLQVIYDRVHEQYPPLKYLAEGNSTLLGEQDIRQRYHPMLQSSSSSKRTNNNNVDVEEEEYQKPALSGDMDLIFVGTASCTPSITRGVSCTALRLHSLASSASVTNKKQQQQQQQTMNVNGKEQRFDVAGSSQSNLGTWLFDCGESTQLQIQKTSSVRPSKITKIFLTHAHGDHSFGLPGLLCLMGQDNSESKGPKAPIDIYGPEGLRLWLRTALRYSVSRICPKYRVHELKDVAMAPEWGYSRKWERYFFNKNVFTNERRAARTPTTIANITGVPPTTGGWNALPLRTGCPTWTGTETSGHPSCMEKWRAGAISIPFTTTHSRATGLPCTRSRMRATTVSRSMQLPCRTESPVSDILSRKRIDPADCGTNSSNPSANETYRRSGKPAFGIP
uniref:Metallo-beta-lactamase domain-containing protein n=2 Tax=Odontella aurita TaxID=265563 RepID=A0A7S4IVQ3_9STRA